MSSTIKWILIGVAAICVIGFLWWGLGPAGALGGGILSGGFAALFGTKRIDKSVSQARLDHAIELGKKNIAEAEREAQQNVKDGLDEHATLADYLNDRTGN